MHRESDRGRELLLLSGYGCGAEGKAIDADTPIALLVLDTSGSLERTNCVCRTASCVECLPDCEKGERNRFTNVLEALTGTFDPFSCEQIVRDEDGVGEDAYDFGYYLTGQQRHNGLLDQYRDQLRFGLATFDSWDTWAGEPPLVARDEFDFERSAGEAGQWSYNPARDIPDFVPDSEEPHGSIRYPNTVNTYFMDTGIRSARAESGALRIAIDPDRASLVNDKLQRSLLELRPYGSTPTAAAFDDLYYLLSQDPKLADVRERGVPVHVVLISDGYPDDDYRTFGCDCLADDNCSPRDEQPQAGLICPYPTPEAGGGLGAHFAQNAVELRAEFESIFEIILASDEASDEP